MDHSAAAPVRCPACGADATGKFCAECGSALGGVRCAGCRSDLTPGARFCHRCGLPAGAEPAGAERSVGGALPWAVAAIALVALVALVAGQRFARPGADATPGAAAASPSTPAGPAPDISNMSPEERASRLYNRVMVLDEAGKTDSVRLFAPMAISAYEMLGGLDADGHYDVGRIAEVAGQVDLAAAHADSILGADPDHLLGLILSARVARVRGDSATERRHLSRFLSVETAQLARSLPEYAGHEYDISVARTEAQRLTGGSR